MKHEQKLRNYLSTWDKEVIIEKEMVNGIHSHGSLTRILYNDQSFTNKICPLG